MLSILLADISLSYLDAIERLINRVGLPTAIIIAISLGVWRFSRWFGVKVAEPLVDLAKAGVGAHVTFLQENTRATQAGAVGVSQVLANQGQSLAMQGRDSEKIDDIHGVIVRSAGTTQQQVTSTAM